MTRSFIALAAVALLAGPAAAASSYSATPVSNPTAAKIATKSILWNCDGGTCSGRTELSRPVVLCEGLAKQTGAISQFMVDGRPLAADDLAKCNKGAKLTTSAPVANAN